MVIDCHVHTCAFSPEHGLTSPHLLRTAPFRFMRWRFGLHGSDARTEVELEGKLFATLGGARDLDAAAVLAFDAVYTPSGQMDSTNTHLYVKNDYVMELARAHRKILFGCSVHPYRADALAELERCIAGGAVLMKWLPITQNFSPADPRCFPLYECLAHHRVPLLSHTGGEATLPQLAPQTADPALLEPALDRGVTVIAAHCGTKSMPWQIDYFPTFARMAREYPNLYGDTSALNLPFRWYAYDALLNDPELRAKLVHGSDWPIFPTPNPRKLGAESLHLLGESNWIQRDIEIKKQLGFDEAYWQRAAGILRKLI
jgi:uncharacterized protein